MNLKLVKKYLCCLIISVVVANVFSTNWHKTLIETGIYAPVGIEGISVSYIDVGTADCSFISADGYNILIDAGISHDAEEITTFLDRYNIEKLDMVIASHSDSDHIGGMAKIIDNYQIGQFVMFDENTGKVEGVVKNLQPSLKENNVKVYYTKAEDIFTLGKIQMTVLSPDHEYENSNDDSVVMKISYGETDFLFTGDASKKVEEYLLENHVDVSSDVLKISHHGSQTATTEKFLKAVNPSVAIVPVGENFYNLPNIQVMKRLKEYKDLDLYRCDDDGTVTVNSDGNKITVFTEK